MKILFLGDIVGNSGCEAVKKNLPNIIRDQKINFVVVNGENAAKNGVGITENITKGMTARRELPIGLNHKACYYQSHSRGL